MIADEPTPAYNGGVLRQTVSSQSRDRTSAARKADRPKRQYHVYNNVVLEGRSEEITHNKNTHTITSHRCSYSYSYGSSFFFVFCIRLLSFFLSFFLFFSFCFFAFFFLFFFVFVCAISFFLSFFLYWGR